FCMRLEEDVGVLVPASNPNGFLPSALLSHRSSLTAEQGANDHPTPPVRATTRRCAPASSTRQPTRQPTRTPPRSRLSRRSRHAMPPRTETRGALAMQSVAPSVRYHRRMSDTDDIMARAGERLASIEENRAKLDAQLDDVR